MCSASLHVHPSCFHLLPLTVPLLSFPSLLSLQLMDWFVQICLAVKHVHDRKILHRDIKSQVSWRCACVTLCVCDCVYCVYTLAIFSTVSAWWCTYYTCIHKVCLSHFCTPYTVQYMLLSCAVTLSPSCNCRTSS